MPLDPALTEFTTTNPILASFDIEDIESGIFQNTYFPLVTKDDTGTQSSLQPNTVNWSSPGDGESRRSSVGTTTVTFDTTAFAISRIVKGTAFISIGAAHNLTSGAYTARLFKFDGSTPTAITPLSTLTVGAGDIQVIYTFEMPCTETTIAVGDKLRLVLSIELGGGTFIAMGHDPKNTDQLSIVPSANRTITATRINVPYKVDR